MADDRGVGSPDDRVEQILQRIAATLGISVAAFHEEAARAPSSRSPVCTETGAARREPLAASDRGTTRRSAPARVTPAVEEPDHERQAAEMQALFERVPDPVEREVCLSFVRACTLR